ncbi:MAG: BspA family leucine-rich repeat surface protein [Enterococcus faecium]|uniref:Bacterial repeat domain-containing protein n=1 Tax=Enterococcus mundtii TaxID=53346 RepID=A0A2T5DG36_ENTMU|nr:BspA family leucine-rich repeat surface protein [Enterococcus mundtii]MBE6173857.1 BspA family leucine-rich repeat surface protein [Enterococcus faecium]PTO37228.1 hypothetical protein C6N14_01660 [Enterococcus mundtii]
MRKKGLSKKQVLVFNILVMMFFMPIGRVIAIHAESEELLEEQSSEHMVLEEDIFHFNGLLQENRADKSSQFEEIEDDWLYDGTEMSTEFIETPELIIEQRDVEQFVNETEGFKPSEEKTIIESGQLGTIPWSLDNTGTMTLGPGIFDEANDIGGRYATTDYFNHFAHRDLIHRIVITGKIELHGHMQGRHNHRESDDASKQGLFSNMLNVQTIEGVHYLDTTNVTNMATMFLNLHSLTDLDLSSFDTTNVKDMSHFFAGMRSITNLDLSSFNTTNVTNMGSMFSFMPNLTNLDVSNFNTENVISMESMFSSSSKLKELDLAHFDTRNVTTMTGMFMHTNELTNLDISNFDTSNVTEMAVMFANTPGLTTLDLSHFDTRKVTTMTGMFDGATSLTELNIQNFNMNGLTEAVTFFFRRAPLRKLVFGENVRFIGMPFLDDLPATDTHRPTWQNVGSGTPENPKGSFRLTSAELMAMYSGNTIADTWVWQPRFFSPFTIDIEGQGTVSPNTTQTVESDEIIDISAKAAPGWHFSHWRMDSGEGDIKDAGSATTTFEMGGEEVRLTAVFVDLNAMMSVRVPISAVFNTTASSNHKTIVSPMYTIYNDSSFGISVDVVTATNLTDVAIIEALNIKGNGNENPLIIQGTVKETNEFQLFYLLTEDSNTFGFTGTAAELPPDKVQITPSFDLVLRFVPNP